MLWLKLSIRSSKLTLKKLTFIDQNRIPLAMVQTMKKLKSGYINGTRVMLGNLGDFLNTSAITDLSFLGSQEDGYPDSELSCIKNEDENSKINGFLSRTESCCSSLFGRTFVAILDHQKYFADKRFFRQRSKEFEAQNVGKGSYKKDTLHQC